MEHAHMPYATRFEPAETPAYSVAQAARYLGLPPGTVEYWLSPKSGPLVLAPMPAPLTLCFKNIVECHVLRALRVERKLKMNRVRDAIFTLRDIWNTRYPLADHELSTDEICVFLQEGNRLYNLSRGGEQAFLEMVRPYLKRIDRDPSSRVATRFYPMLKAPKIGPRVEEEPRYIVVDPRVCFGRAVIKGTRISTEVVAGRVRAGERITKLAAQYGRTKEEIEAALQFETRRRAG